jgi:hypothetical protein
MLKLRKHTPINNYQAGRLLTIDTKPREFKVQGVTFPVAHMQCSSNLLWRTFKNDRLPKYSTGVTSCGGYLWIAY